MGITFFKGHFNAKPKQLNSSRHIYNLTLHKVVPLAQQVCAALPIAAAPLIPTETSHALQGPPNKSHLVLNCSIVTRKKLFILKRPHESSPRNAKHSIGYISRTIVCPTSSAPERQAMGRVGVSTLAPLVASESNLATCQAPCHFFKSQNCKTVKRTVKQDHSTNQACT